MSAPRIGQLLLARGACSREDLYAAWEQKVLFGDRLGTNLLAEARVSEKDLALALGQQHRVRAGFEDTIRVKPEVARQLPGKFAAEARVVPHHIGSAGVFLLMTDPGDEATINQVAARFSRPVVPVVVAEARMWQLLSETYGISPGLRPIPLGRDAIVAKRMQPADTLSMPAVTGPELTSEEDFAALYMRKDGGSMTPQSFDEVETATDGPAATAEAMLLTSVAPPAATDVPSSPGHAFVVPDTFVGQAPDDALAGRWVPAGHAPVVPFGLDTPLSVEQARALLAQVHNREEIAEVVLRAALSNFRRAALFTVHPGMLVGWKGRGEGFSDALIQHYRAVLDQDSVFRTVVKSRAHFIGPLARVRAHAGWVKHTHRKIPQTVALFPVLVRGHVVNLLYGDNGHGETVDTDVGDLLILAQAIARSYETLLGG